MSPAGFDHVTAYDRAAVRLKLHRIAANLAGEAFDPASDLTVEDRRALAALSLALGLKASRHAGVDPSIAQAQSWLSEVERGTIPVVMPTAPAVGSSRGHRHAS